MFFDQICPNSKFPVEKRKIAHVRASMMVTYYSKLFRTGADRHNGILMYLLLLVAETINFVIFLVLSLIDKLSFSSMIRYIYEKQISIHELSNSTTLLNFKVSLVIVPLPLRIAYEHRYVSHL